MEIISKINGMNILVISGFILMSASPSLHASPKPPTESALAVSPAFNDSCEIRVRGMSPAVGPDDEKLVQRKLAERAAWAADSEGQEVEADLQSYQVDIVNAYEDLPMDKRIVALEMIICDLEQKKQSFEAALESAPGNIVVRWNNQKKLKYANWYASLGAYAGVLLRQAECHAGSQLMHKPVPRIEASKLENTAPRASKIAENSWRIDTCSAVTASAWLGDPYNARAGTTVHYVDTTAQDGEKKEESTQEKRLLRGTLNESVIRFDAITQNNFKEINGRSRIDTLWGKAHYIREMECLVKWFAKQEKEFLEQNKSVNGSPFSTLLGNYTSRLHYMAEDLNEQLTKEWKQPYEKPIERILKEWTQRWQAQKANSKAE